LRVKPLKNIFHRRKIYVDNYDNIVYTVYTMYEGALLKWEVVREGVMKPQKVHYDWPVVNSTCSFPRHQLEDVVPRKQTK
jgi:hypothetical protein